MIACLSSAKDFAMVRVMKTLKLRFPAVQQQSTGGDQAAAGESIGALGR